MAMVVEFTKAEMLIRLMKEAEKYFAVGGQDKKEWVLMRLYKHLKVDEETKKFISDLVDIIILLDKNKLKIGEVVTDRCCGIL